MRVNTYTAKSRLSRLIDRATAGDEVVITRRGRPVARLVVLEAQQAPRKLGALRGRVRIADDFDAPPPEDVSMGFEGLDGLRGAR